MIKKYQYNTEKFPFINITKKIFDIQNLENIHRLLEKPLDIPTNHHQDQKSDLHKIFYKNYEDVSSDFLTTYRNFVSYLATEHFNSMNLIYQTKPTFRVHTPGSLAVAKWHKDKIYNHSHQEINIFLPLTKAFDTNTIWTESIEDLGDFQPMEAIPGEYYIWDGANLMHGNKQNTTNSSRVSVDFRIINKDNFNYKGESVTTKVPMKLGCYWSELN